VVNLYAVRGAVSSRLVAVEICGGNRTHRTVVPSPENHRRPFTHILGNARVQNDPTGTHKLHAVLLSSFTYLSTLPLLFTLATFIVHRNGVSVRVRSTC
jgi:hypothetical protein